MFFFTYDGGDAGETRPPPLVGEESRPESKDHARGRKSGDSSRRPTNEKDKKRKKRRKKERKTHKERKRKTRAGAATTVTTAYTADARARPCEKRKRGDSREVPGQDASTRTSSALPNTAAPTSASGGSRGTGEIRKAAHPRPPALASLSSTGISGGGGGTDEAARVEKARSMVPMRPEEYAAQQREVREVRPEGPPPGLIRAVSSVGCCRSCWETC